MYKILSWLDRRFLSLVMRLKVFTKEAILEHSLYSKSVTSMDYRLGFDFTTGSESKTILTEYGFFFVATGLNVSFEYGPLGLPIFIQLTNKRTGKTLFGGFAENRASAANAAGPGPSAILTEPGEINIPLVNSEPIEITIYRHPLDVARIIQANVIISGWKWEV